VVEIVRCRSRELFTRVGNVCIDAIGGSKWVASRKKNRSLGLETVIVVQAMLFSLLLAPKMVT
jgi:hypothetical protein